MISHGKDIKIFTGNANPKLAADICKIIGTKLGESEVKSFADGEASVSLYETVRGSDVFLIQSTCKPVNDSLMELLIMVGNENIAFRMIDNVAPSRRYNALRIRIREACGK